MIEAEISELVRRRQIQIQDLVETQIVSFIKQLIESGDIKKYLMKGGRSIQAQPGDLYTLTHEERVGVVYVPFMGVNDLKNKVSRLEERLALATEALEFYGNLDRMHDEAFGAQGKILLPDLDEDCEPIQGRHYLWFGKRAREALQKIKGLKS